MVQDILSEADGDAVNSITDTVESDQCARVIRDVWNTIVDTHDFGFIKTLKQLDATSGTTPNVMTRPEGYYNIEFVRYDKRATAGADQNYEDIHYMKVYDFIDLCSARATSDSNVSAITLSTGHIIPVKTDVAPTYYTIMDEGSDELVFDSYDSDLDTNLQQSKSLVYASVKPTLTLADATEISLPKHLATLVKTQSRAMYFDLYKDGITSEIDRARRRAEVRAQRLRNVVKNTDNDNGPDYGR